MSFEQYGDGDAPAFGAEASEAYSLKQDNVFLGILDHISNGGLFEASRA